MCGILEIALISLVAMICPSKMNKAVRDAFGAMKVKAQYRYRKLINDGNK